MKNRGKILLALVMVLIMVVGMFAITASAVSIPAKTKLYLKPNANWKIDNARFAAYFFGNGEAWVSMTDPDGDGIYECESPNKSYTNVIFCRMNPNTTANNWNNKWNQTSDLTYNGSSNLYTVKEGTWDKGGGTWSLMDTSCKHTGGNPATCTTDQICSKCGEVYVAALGHSYNSSHTCTRSGCGLQASFTVAGTGAHLGTEWDTTNVANDMTYDATSGIYTKIYEDVAAGSYLFKVARDHAWDVSYPSADKSYSVASSGSTVTITLKGTTVNVEISVPVAQIGSEKYYDLQSAIDAAVDGDTITLLANCTGDVTIVRAPDVNITLDGNNKTFSGSITVDGKSATYATGSLTIKNVNFNATNITKEASINFGVSGNDNTRYITNVTVENCTFTGASQKKVAIKSYTGGDKNISVVGCTVDNTMHSLLQVANVAGLEIDDCTVNSKNGINLNNSSNVVIKNSTVDVSGYAVRAGADTEGDSGAVTLTGNTLKSAAADEGVIVLRGKAQTKIDLVMSENVLSGAIHVQGTVATTKISAEFNYWDGKTVPAVDGTPIKVIDVYADEAKTETAVAGLHGAGTEADPFLINNLKDLVWFANDVNAGNTYAKKFVKLTADIDLENNAWTPIGTSKKVSFQGTFDGGEHTVSNLYINNEDLSYAGLFGYAQNAKINNVNVHNVNIVAYSNVAAIAGTVYTGSVSNCHVSGSINLVASYAYAAGIVSDGYVTVSDCSVIADGMGVIYVGEKTMAGGITGWIGEGNNGVYNCTVKNLDITAWTSVGAITGLVHYNNTITGCVAENINLVKTRVNGNGAIGLAAGNWVAKDDGDYTTTVTNNSFANITINGSAVVEGTLLCGSNYSGYNNNNSKLVADGNTFENITSDITLVVLNATDIKNAFEYNESGVVIYLGDNITITETLVVENKAITLNLNGYTLAFEGAATYSLRNTNAIIFVGGNGSLVIEGEGKVETNGAAIVVDEDAELEITGGSFDTDISEFAGEGLRATPSVQPDGTVVYVVVSNDDTAHIGNDGNWWVGDHNTGVPAQHNIEIVEHNGLLYWSINGVRTEMLANPVDGYNPKIDVIDGFWAIDLGEGFVSTGVFAGCVDGINILSITVLEINGNVCKYEIKYDNDTTSTFVVSNGVDGNRGPQGEEGPQGIVGPKGETGPAGANGADNNWLVNPVLIACISAIVLSVVVVLIVNRKVLVNQILKYR